MKAKVLGFCLVVLLLACNICVFAASLDSAQAVCNPDGSITLKGKITHIREGEIQFFITEKTVEAVSLTDENIKQNILFLGRFETERTGEFEQTFIMPEDMSTNLYSVHFLLVGGNGKKSELKYVNEADSAAALSSINASTQQTIITVVKGNENSIPMSFTYINNANFNNNMFAQFVFDEKPSSGFATISDFVRTANRAAATVVLQSRLVDVTEVKNLIQNYGQELGIDVTEFNGFSNGLKSAVATALLAEAYASPSDLGIKYPKILMNAKVANSENKWSDLMRYLTVDYADEYNLPIGAGTDYYSVRNKESVFQKMVGNNLSTKALIAQAFSAAVAEQKKVESQADKGGRGGGPVSGAVKENITLNMADNLDKPKDNQNADAAFTDITDVLWAEDAINTLSSLGVLGGDGNGRFRPNDKITRAEFAKIVTVAFGLNDKYTLAEFSDVKYDDWYHPYIISLYKKGIIKGMSDNYFGANENITREDMVTILYRVKEHVEVTFEEKSEITLRDEESFSDYSKDAVIDFVKSGIVNGNENGYFMPKSNATRAEAARVVYGFLRNIEFVNLKAETEEAK